VITLEQAMNGKPSPTPHCLRLFADQRRSSGVFARATRARGRIRVETGEDLGRRSDVDHVALDAKEDITTFRAVAAAGQKAVQDGGGHGEDIEFAEVHDCFTIAEIIATEDLGFVGKGEGGPYAASGATCLKGSRPVNTSEA